MNKFYKKLNFFNLNIVINFSLLKMGWHFIAGTIIFLIGIKIYAMYLSRETPTAWELQLKSEDDSHWYNYNID